MKALVGDEDLDLMFAADPIGDDLGLPDRHPSSTPTPVAFGKMDQPAFAEAPKARPSPPERRAPEMKAAKAPAPARARESQTEGNPSGWLIYAVAIFVSIIWALAPIAFAYGYRQAKAPFDFDPFVMSVLLGMAMGPAAFVWFAAYSIQQGRKLSVETQRAKAFTDQMIGPSLAAGIGAGEIVAGLRQEIAATAAAAELAQRSILTLRNTVDQESSALARSTENAVQLTGTLALTMSHHRNEIVELAQMLDGQIRLMAETLGQNAETLARISGETDVQVQATEALLASRTSELSAVTQEVANTARVAGEDLTRHIARIETAGLGLSDQIEAAQIGLTEQRAGLVSVTHALRIDQTAFAEQAESHTAQLSGYIETARMSAFEMSDQVLQGGVNLKDLVEQAAEQFREMTEAARRERDAFARANQEALQAVTDAALLERKRLEDQAREAVDILAQLGHQSRLQSERHIDTLRDQVDRLSESAFVAGQKANQVFESRLAEAHDLIDRSAQLVEQAGAATARKLDEGAERARATLEDLSDMLAEIEARAARLPAAARGQAEQVRQAVSEGMDDLIAQARRTAEETQAIDAAFQDRVRRNYDMLSDAVRLMGSVSGVTSTAPVLPADAVLDGPPPPVQKARRQPAPPPVVEREDVALPAPSPKRTRLKLTPTATDAEFDSVFASASGRPAPASSPKPASKPAAKPVGASREEWTWKDLLTSIDKPETRAEPRAASHPLGRELESLGIDAQALLPLRSIQDVAEALADQNAEAAQDIVKRAAPAGIRRLARRMLHDPDLRGQAQDFLMDSQDALMDILQQGGPVSSTVAFLNTEAGRIYLLFESAAGDLA